jgi:hypothetical protein
MRWDIPIRIYNHDIYTGHTYWVNITAVPWATPIHFFAWALLPMTMEYERAGEFTFKTKCIYAFKRNALTMSMQATCGISVLIWSMIHFQASFQQVKGVLLSMSNTYGSTLVVMLMGHGLVNVPRQMWRSTNPQNELDRLYFNAASYDAALYEAEEEMKEVMKDIVDMQGQLLHLETTGDVRTNMDTVLAAIPENLMATTSFIPLKRTSRDNDMIALALNPKRQISKMASVHFRVRLNFFNIITLAKAKSL